MRFLNKVTLITGGNAGIGLATARRFATEGAKVIIAARDVYRSETAVQTIRNVGGIAHFIPLDVRQADQCQKAIEESVARFGGLDVLVNNAGVIYRQRNVLQTAVEEWDETFDVNVKGAFYMSKFALPHLIETQGNIVNVSSYLGLVGAPGLVAYCASKGALTQFTRAVALDHAGDAVRVNCVCPGSVLTPMIEAAWESYGDGAEQVWASKHPVGRIAHVDEVAKAILFLASQEASFITGTALPVDGGITAG